MLPLSVILKSSGLSVRPSLTSVPVVFIYAAQLLNINSRTEMDKQAAQLFLIKSLRFIFIAAYSDLRNFITWAF